MEKKHKVSISEAAATMGVSQQFVRVGLQKGALPFGTAVQVSRNKYTYFISRSQFNEYLGIKGEAEKCQSPAGTSWHDAVHAVRRRLRRSSVPYQN